MGDDGDDESSTPQFVSAVVRRTAERPNSERRRGVITLKVHNNKGS